MVKTEDLLEFSSLGTYCQFDLFGTECSLYQMNLSVDMPSDAQRMDKVVSLIEAGKEDRILLAHDIHTKHRLVNFYGFKSQNGQLLSDEILSLSMLS
jgi:phosphotriesterase-related protein